MLGQTTSPNDLTAPLLSGENTESTPTTSSATTENVGANPETTVETPSLATSASVANPAQTSVDAAKIDEKASQESIPSVSPATSSSPEANGDETFELIDGAIPTAKPTMRQRIASLPRAALKELGGSVGSIGALILAFYHGIKIFGPIYAKHILQPAATLLVAATFPGAIIPADLLLFAINSPAILDVAFAALIVYNKSIIGKYFKKTRDTVLDSWRKMWNIGKLPPENVSRWSLENIRFHVLDLAGDLLSLIPGAIGAAAGVALLRFSSLGLLRAVTGIPVLNTVRAFTNELKSIALYTVMVIVGKELPDVVIKNGEKFGKHVVDDVLDGAEWLAKKSAGPASAAAATVSDAASYAASGARSGLESIGNGISSAASSARNGLNQIGNGLSSAASTAFSPFYRATRSQSESNAVSGTQPAQPGQPHATLVIQQEIDITPVLRATNTMA